MKSTMLTASVCALVLACAAPQKGGKAETTGKALRTGMLLVSTAFNDGELIPAKYSGYGENVSPDLAWAQAPEGVRSYALICRDPDAPGGTFYHWVVFNIPDSVRQLPEGLGHASALPFGGTQGTNSFGKVGYDGPKPPVGTHRYYFDLYALDAAFTPDQTTTAGQLTEKVKGHVLARATLMGKYAR
ncbi:MAG: YbhB/YbcL family Raf kinase inhibitor-like protein [candidate division WOR-3 bacterium]|nr:YbhB/YbcL family Raf kinase inhibitor-like protein [candidate division WOR-3 bacterium]